MNKLIYFLFGLCLLPSIIVTNSFVDNYYYQNYFGELILVTISTVILGVIALYKHKTKQLSFSISIIDLLLLSWFTVSSFQFLVNGNTTTFQQYLIFSVFTALYFVSKTLIKQSFDSKAVSLLTWIFLIVGCFQLLYGILQLSGRMETSPIYPIIGTFGNSGLYSQFLSLISIWLFGIIIYSTYTTKLRVLSIVFFVISLFIIIYLKSRISVFTIVLCCTIHLAIKYKILDKIRKYSHYYKSLLIIITLAILTLSGYFLFKMKSESSNGRLFIWKQTVSIIKEHPLGIGFGNFSQYYNEKQSDYFDKNKNDTSNAKLAENMGYAFCEPLHIAAEIGIIGALLYVAIFLYVFLMLFRSRYLNIYILNSLIALIAYFFISLTAYPNQIVILFFLFFLFLTISSSEDKILFSLSNIVNKYVLILVIGLSSFFSYKEIEKISSYTSWKKALENLHQGDASALNTYANIYPVLQNDKLFLFNYGSELSVAKYYEESIPLLESLAVTSNDYSTHLYLGNSYEGKGDTARAIYHFQKACLLIPSRIYSKYRLFALFASKNDIKAKYYAHEIINTQSKGISENVAPLKQQAMLYLEAHKNNN